MHLKENKVIPSRKINLVLYTPSNSFHLRASYLRGDEFSIGFTLNGLWKKNKSASKLDRKIELERNKIKVVTSQQRYLYLATLRYLQDTGFQLNQQP